MPGPWKLTQRFHDIDSLLPVMCPASEDEKVIFFA